MQLTWVVVRKFLWTPIRVVDSVLWRVLRRLPTLERSRKDADVSTACEAVDLPAQHKKWHFILENAKPLLLNSWNSTVISTRRPFTCIHQFSHVHIFSPRHPPCVTNILLNWLIISCKIVTLEYVSIDFIRTKRFSHVTTVKLSTSGSLTLTWYYYTFLGTIPKFPVSQERVLEQCVSDSGANPQAHVTLTVTALFSVNRDQIHSLCAFRDTDSLEKNRPVVL